MNCQENAKKIADYVMKEGVDEKRQQIEEMKMIAEEKKEMLKTLQESTQKIIKNQQDANALISSAISDHDKKVIYQTFEEKIQKYETDLQNIVDHHMIDSRKIEIETIQALNEAQQFELETIRKFQRV